MFNKAIITTKIKLPFLDLSTIYHFLTNPKCVKKDMSKSLNAQKFII